MEIETHHSASATDPAVINPARLAALEKGRGEIPPPSVPDLREKAKQVAPHDFVPLHLETRTHVTTAVMCRHIGRRPQTARGWASAETYPPGLKPLRVMGRLAWPVSGIRAVLGVA
jgi:hypothetical protein